MSSGTYRFIGNCIRRSVKNVEAVDARVTSTTINTRHYHMLKLGSTNTTASSIQQSSSTAVQHLNVYNKNNFLNPSSTTQQFVCFSDKTPSEEETKKSDEETTSPEEENKEEEEQQQQTQQTLSKEEELETQVKDLKDQLLRSLAEQENIRRIAKRDVDNSRSYAISSFAKSLLETSDNLSRALEAVPEEYRTDNEDHPVLATLYQGISMTDNGLTKAFEKNGLKKYGEVGDVFDPNLHEALYEYADESKDVGTVGQVMKHGFMLKDRVIRPADVGVIKKA